MSDITVNNPETPATTAPTEPTAETPQPPPEKPLNADGYPDETPIADMAPEQQAAYWRAKARKHEDAAKANADKAKRFDEFEESQKSELQKAQDAAAKAASEAEGARAELAVLQAAVKHGLSEDDLELLGTHGTPEEIEARAERLANRIKSVEESRPKPDFGGGERGDDIAAGKQWTQSDLDKASPEQIVQAKKDGLLNNLLGVN